MAVNQTDKTRDCRQGGEKKKPPTRKWRGWPSSVPLPLTRQGMECEPCRTCAHSRQRKLHLSHALMKRAARHASGPLRTELQMHRLTFRCSRGRAGPCGTLWRPRPTAQRCSVRVFTVYTKFERTAFIRISEGIISSERISRITYMARIGHRILKINYKAKT